MNSNEGYGKKRNFPTDHFKILSIDICRYLVQSEASIWLYTGSTWLNCSSVISVKLDSLCVWFFLSREWFLLLGGSGFLFYFIFCILLSDLAFPSAMQ